MTLMQDTLETPVGTFVIVVDGEGRLDGAGFIGGDARAYPHLVAAAALPRAHDHRGVTSRMRAYFAGEPGALEGLVTTERGTPFQREVWAALREIPCGETRSYAQIAERIGRPKAVRAVGLANGSNPVGVVVPCHRVIGANGSLTGYGGGLSRKKWLLAHEARLSPSPSTRWGAGATARLL